MKDFIITNPIITVETAEEKALIDKLYPKATIMDTRHAFLPDKFTLEELSDLKAKLAIAGRLIRAGNFRAGQIEFDNLNRKQAIYLRGRNSQNIIYTYDWEEVCDIEDHISHPDTQGPWRAEVNEVLTRRQVNDLYNALDSLK